MATVMQGQVIGQDKMGIPNLAVEVWETDDEANLLGTKPLLRSTTHSGGYFHIDTQRLPSGTELPGNSIILFRYGTGVEVGRTIVMPEAIKGQAIRYEDPKLVAAKLLEIWPLDYSPIKHIPEDVKTKLKLSPHEELVLESVPQVEHFATYAYLWPSPLIPEDQQGEQLALQQPFLLGVQVLHRQEWHLLGHSRGELLHSLPLAPGEETTIEILTWDRNVYKREEEITSDLEREVEENRQFKDSREVFREIQKDKKWKVGGSLGVNILDIVKIGGGGGYEEQTKEVNRSSLNTIVETTDRASTKVHNQRKTSISSTREFGREEKVTRKVTNTNRCHSVAYHFYEILRNYKVLTSLASPAARPTIFWKQNHPIDRQKLLAEPFDYHTFLEVLRWLHFNSHLIARGLLDRSFFRALELLPELVAYWTLRRGAAATGIDFDPMLRPFVRNLITSAQKVSESGLFTPLWHLNAYVFLCMPWLYTMILEGEDSLKWVSEHQDPNRQNELKDAVEHFLSTWDELYPPVHVVSGYDCARHNYVEDESYRKYLFDHVIRLKTEYTRWVFGPSPGEEPDPDQLNRMRDVAEVVRLMRHIYHNYLHYFQLIWSAKGAEERLLEAREIVLSGDVRLLDVIKPDLLGFYGDYAIFPFTKAEEGSELAQLVQAFQELEGQPPTESEVVLPSNGIVVEPQLGEFTACESFIEKHRVHDLQLKSSEVQKAELENQRRQKKIRMCELENPECCPTPKYGFFHRLFCRFKGNNKE
jgi:hypothetical protein